MPKVTPQVIARVRRPRRRARRAHPRARHVRRRARPPGRARQRVLRRRRRARGRRRRARRAQAHRRVPDRGRASLLGRRHRHARGARGPAHVALASAAAAACAVADADLRPASGRPVEQHRALPADEAIRGTRAGTRAGRRCREPTGAARRRTASGAMTGASVNEKCSKPSNCSASRGPVERVSRPRTSRRASNAGPAAMTMKARADAAARRCALDEPVHVDAGSDRRLEAHHRGGRGSSERVADDGDPPTVGARPVPDRVEPAQDEAQVGDPRIVALEGPRHRHDLARRASSTGASPGRRPPRRGSRGSRGPPRAPDRARSTPRRRVRTARPAACRLSRRRPRAGMDSHERQRQRRARARGVVGVQRRERGGERRAGEPRERRAPARARRPGRCA